MPNLLGSMNRDTFIKIMAVVLVILGVVQLVIGAGMFLGGGFLGAGAAGLVAGNAVVDEAAAAAATAVAIGGAAMVFGAVMLFVGVLSLVAAIALFRKFRWARMATVTVMLLGFAGELIVLLVGGFALVPLILLIIYALGAYIFFSDEPIKQALPS